MPKRVFLRKIDERLYAETKARAAVLGITVSEAVNRALEAWLSNSTPAIPGGTSRRRKIRDVARRIAEGREKGILVLANDGNLYAFFDTLEDALEWLRDLHSRGVLKNSLIKPLGGGEVRYLEVGGGEDELLRKL